MNRNSEKGIALIITLIMLALVTMMALVFLSVSRREKASVTVTADLTGAKLMADAAMARAEGEVAARVLSSGNPGDYGFLVSTNFISSAGFMTGRGFNPTNVSYVYPTGIPVNRQHLLQNLANLQYDPRPPVFVTTNNNGESEFRFYLDLNRNGMFEPSGWQPVLGLNGMPLSTNGTPTTFGAPDVLSNYFVGDPEWIGVLERPDLPHSETNRFIGRYAFLTMPAGKSLDINHIHNNAKVLNPNSDGFMRNLGVGSWELNLAGFLVDLNTNAWPRRQYLYNPANPSAQNTGLAFEHARSILQYRYRNSNPLLETVNQLFGPAGSVFPTSGLDIYSDGPLFLSGTPPSIYFNPVNQDNIARPWSGSDNPEAFYDVQEMFDFSKLPQQFVNLLGMASRRRDSYNRYTYYRLLSQIGTDSRPAHSNWLFQADMRRAPTNRLNLNFRNDIAGGATNFVAWNAEDFFMQAADRILRANLNTNLFINGGGLVRTNFVLGARTGFDAGGNMMVTNLPVRPQFSITNMLIYPETAWDGTHISHIGEYNATVHRLLQVAANIYDATTTKAGNLGKDFPSVFRPVFYKEIDANDNQPYVYIVGYREVTNANQILNAASTVWRTKEQVATGFPANTVLDNLIIYGIPWVIGAKKGFPNFNEFTIQSAIQVSRKLEVRKPNLDAFPNMTNQMYVLGISNVFGVEGWNPYAQDYNRNYELRVTNRFSIVLSNATTRIRELSGAVGTTLSGNNWTNQTFQVPIYTNVLFLTNSAYINFPPYFFPEGNTNYFESSFHPPEWHLHMSNRLQYVLVDRAANRVIDFVNLDGMNTYIDIGRQLAGTRTSDRDRQIVTQPPGPARRNPGGGQSVPISESELWITDRVVRGNLNSPTIGVTNQVGVALGALDPGGATWRDASGSPVAGGNKEKAISEFRDFMFGQTRSPSLRMQVPFTPTRKAVQTLSWQVNDPLVRFTMEDLEDPRLTGRTNSLQFIPPLSPLPNANLGRMNQRYNPWGGNPNQDPASDQRAFDLSLKDPGVWRSDDWFFPTNRFATLGWLGRVHRGTPWQTLYLKSAKADDHRWAEWSGSYGTHPTNDWKLMELFTVAPNDNAARGLLSANQDGQAAWSAVLSGVAVMSNSVPNQRLGPGVAGQYSDLFIQPGTPQLAQIVDGINRTRAGQANGMFQTMGAVLATPELSDASPFLNLSQEQRQYGLTDEAYERIPQQILSLLKPDDTRIVVYGFGQSLRPAPNSIVTAANFYNMVTNYQVAGEVFTKTVLRMEPVPHTTNQWRAVRESYQILPPD